MFEAYGVTFFAIAVILATVLVQWLIASGQKAKEQGAIPGTPPQQQGHESFTFRAWRTHQNSVENLSVMLGTVFLAVISGLSPFWTALLTGLFAVARILHMILYYVIATNKNPSPRSYFFMLGWLANVALLLMTVGHLIGSYL